MGLYNMTNVPVLDDSRTIHLEVTVLGVTLWNAKASDPENREHWWRIADIDIGDHMFEPERQELLRRCYAHDVVSALNRGIKIGYARAQSDIRKALGVQP
jgi:hypothetical protein